MQDKLKELKDRLLEVDNLNHAASVLTWDQSTYMPPGGAPARARQMATLGRLAHEKFVDASIGRLLDALRPYEESLPYDADDAALIRVTRRDYERLVRVPNELVAEFTNHGAMSYQAWTEARPANDFKRMEPLLAKTIDLSRRYANCFPGYEHIADPLIDQADYGMKAASLRVLFDELRRELVPLVQAISAQAEADDACLRRHFPEDRQLAFGMEVVKQFGYDLYRGRQDKTHHPFMIKFSLGDVRITTRVKEDYLGEALFSTMHESGHAMYEQGINLDYEGTPLAGGTSAGVHESSSRLWENLVGRSRGFWEHYYPKLQAVFPDQLGGVPLDTYYRAVNKVERSLIRTDADEVTYNLHVMIRFGLELELLEGRLAARDLPEAWHERYQADLGVHAPDDRDGILQDVHWYAGAVGGAFQGYSLGNIIGAQFFDAALKAQPGIPGEIRQGQFRSLWGWLREHVYKPGRKYTAPELIERATGQPLTIAPYIRYLKEKFGELYRIPVAAL